MPPPAAAAAVVPLPRSHERHGPAAKIHLELPDDPGADLGSPKEWHAIRREEIKGHTLSIFRLFY